MQRLYRVEITYSATHYVYAESSDDAEVRAEEQAQEDVVMGGFHADAIEIDAIPHDFFASALED